mmetsp:Transcript_38026/g.58049  ORF Transcript_38026/g.58049 Transcript_38026/m.58049 type:complete len:82 (-) Transcript_38026:186-431(-)
MKNSYAYPFLNFLLTSDQSISFDQRYQPTSHLAFPFHKLEDCDATVTSSTSLQYMMPTDLYKQDTPINKLSIIEQIFPFKG